MEYKALLLTFTKIPEIKAKELLEIIEQLAIKIFVQEEYAVCKDMSNNKVMDCAVNGAVDYLVTKNLKHFPKDFRGVEIISVGDFFGCSRKV